MDFMITLGEALQPFLLSALTLAAAAGTRWLAGKFRNERIAAAILRVDDAAIKVVRSISAAWVDAIKAGRAPDSESGAVLTQAEKAKARSEALRALKAYMGVSGLRELKWVITGDSGTIDDFLMAALEAALANTKVNDKAAAPVNPT